MGSDEETLRKGQVPRGGVALRDPGGGQVVRAGMVSAPISRSVAVAAAGEDVEAEEAPAFGPVVGLLGKDGADEAHDRFAVGEDPNGVGAAADFGVGSLGGVLRPDLGPHVFGEGGEREEVLTGLSEVFCGRS